MGKVLIEFGIPGLFAAIFGWHAVKLWYLKVFPDGIRSYKEIRKASDKYEKDISK